MRKIFEELSDDPIMITVTHVLQTIVGLMLSAEERNKYRTNDIVTKSKKQSLSGVNYGDLQNNLVHMVSFFTPLVYVKAKEEGELGYWKNEDQLVNYAEENLRSVLKGTYDKKITETHRQQIEKFWDDIRPTIVGEEGMAEWMQSLEDSKVSPKNSSRLKTLFKNNPLFKGKKETEELIEENYGDRIYKQKHTMIKDFRGFLISLNENTTQIHRKSNYKVTNESDSWEEDWNEGDTEVEVGGRSTLWVKKIDVTTKKSGGQISFSFSDPSRKSLKQIEGTLDLHIDEKNDDGSYIDIEMDKPVGIALPYNTCENFIMEIKKSLKKIKAPYWTESHPFVTSYLEDFFTTPKKLEYSGRIKSVKSWK
jgi:hypothetical protein